MSKVTFGNPFADVDIQPVQVGGVRDTNRIAVRVKDDAGDYQLAGVLGKDYQLLPNRRVRDLAEDVMSRASRQFGGFTHLKTMFDGKRYVDYFHSDEPVYDDNLKLKLGLMAWNSYDGTRKTGFEVFALNPFCTNQYHARNRLGFFAWRHTSGQTIDMDDALSQIAVGADNLIAMAPRIRELQREPVTVKTLTTAALRTDFPVSMWGRVLKRLDMEEQNAFGLYQALTNVCSHEMHGLNAINVSSDITEFFLEPDRREVSHHTNPEAVLASR